MAKIGLGRWNLFLVEFYETVSVYGTLFLVTIEKYWTCFVFKGSEKSNITIFKAFSEFTVILLANLIFYKSLLFPFKYKSAKQAEISLENCLKSMSCPKSFISLCSGEKSLPFKPHFTPVNIYCVFCV